MSERIVAAGAGRRMPWKNGRGTTLELATDAPETDPTAWTWRLSIADVPDRGPFSRFPAIDRRIACLVGDGLRLHRCGRVEIVPTSGDAVAFAGEEEVEGEPLGMGVRDVNLLVRRDRHAGSLRIVRGGSGEARGATVLVHAFETGGPLPVEVGGRTVTVGHGETLIAPGSARWPDRTGAVLVVAELRSIDAR